MSPMSHEFSFLGMVDSTFQALCVIQSGLSGIGSNMLKALSRITPHKSPTSSDRSRFISPHQCGKFDGPSG